MSRVIFEDRRDAGRQLGKALVDRGYGDHLPVVLGIPRGGVVVASEVAEALRAPLDVIIARKLRAPDQPELGIGAIVNGDPIPILNEELVRAVGLTRNDLDEEIAFQRREIERRIEFYREDRPPLEVSEKTVIVVDDGIATGYTFRAALEALRRRHPGTLVAAAPVAAPDSINMLAAFADDVVCLETPMAFIAVGAWYRDFDQVSDDEVVVILRSHWRPLPAA